MRRIIQAALAAVVLAAATLAPVQAATEHCPAGGAKYQASDNPEADFNLIVLDLGTQFCVKAGNEATGILIADGVKPLTDYLQLMGIVGGDGLGRDVSYYVIYPEVTPSPSSEPSSTPSVQPSPSASTQPTPSPLPSSTPEPSPEPTPTPSATPTPSPSGTPTPTTSPTPSPVPTASVEPSPATPAARTLPPTDTAAEERAYDESTDNLPLIAGVALILWLVMLALTASNSTRRRS